MTQKTTQPWTFDTRVRERNLRSGAVTEKDVEKYLSQLPDLADQAEPFALSQPALAQPEVEDEEPEEDEEPQATETAAAAPEASPES